MKKICIILSLVILLFELKVQDNFCYAKAEVSTYAKVTQECILYKTTTLENNIDNVYFTIPETYFVMIIDTISDNCYKVQYGDYIGYINSANAILATFIPIVKTLDEIFCDVKTSSGTQVWSKPSASSAILTTIPAGTKNLKYIATTYGEKPSGGECNVWYYVNYTPENNSTNVYEGYVYSENITNMTEIVANTETNPEPIPDEKISDYALYISSPIKVLLISIVAIPIIILFLILVHKISKILKERSTKDESKQEYSNQNVYENKNYENNEYNGESLRQEINNMSKKPFVRKINSLKRNDNNYPAFPSYDSDDDLL